MDMSSISWTGTFITRRRRRGTIPETEIFYVPMRKDLNKNETVYEIIECVEEIAKSILEAQGETDVTCIKLPQETQRSFQDNYGRVSSHTRNIQYKKRGSIFEHTHLRN